MFERFSDRARKVMALANQEAHRFNHEYIGTEHILLGLVKEGSGVGANVLKNLEVDLRKVRLEVEKLIKSGPDMVIMGKLPQTPRLNKVIEFATEEARAMQTEEVGTEHLLLGLLREQDSVAAEILTLFGVKLEGVREEILRIRISTASITSTEKEVGTEKPPTPEEKFDDFATCEMLLSCEETDYARVLSINANFILRTGYLDLLVPGNLVACMVAAADLKTGLVDPHKLCEFFQAKFCTATLVPITTSDVPLHPDI